MSTRSDDIQSGNLRRFADRELTVRIDGDQFRISRNNAFSRLVVWVHTDLLPSIRTRRVVEARDRFIAAVGSRAGSEGGVAAHDSHGAGSTPLTSRDVRQISGTPTWREPERPPPASPESAVSRPREPGPDASSDTRSATLAAAAHAGASPGAPQGQLPADGSFYRESQESGTDLSGMHALNAFLGGPVVGADEYRTMSIEFTTDTLGVEGAQRDESQPPVPRDASTDGRLDPAGTHAAVETGVTIPDAAEHPEDHARARARINAFPGDRLMVGYSRGDTGKAHMIALRREEDGHWQVLDSHQASTAPPIRAADLADCFEALPSNLLVVHREAGFSFLQRPAAWQPTGAEASPEDLPTPELSESESTESTDSQQTVVDGSPDYLPPPVFSESESAGSAGSQQPADEDSPDYLPPPVFSESEETTPVVAQEHGSPVNPPDDPSAAADGPTDPAALEVQGEVEGDPQLQPYLRHGIAAEYAQPLLLAGVPPLNAALFLGAIHRRGDDPREVFQSGIPLGELRTVYRDGYGLREARMLCLDARLPATVLRDVYDLHRIPVRPDTLIRYTDADRAGGPQELVRTNTHTVYSLEYNDGVRRVFKPLVAPHPNLQQQIEHGWTAVATGIDTRNPQLAMRNIVTYRLAKELDFDVVVQTQLGLHKLPEQADEDPPQLGMVMEFAPGRMAGSRLLSPSTFERPDVRSGTTKLQLLDCLTAQGDRHHSNYFVRVRPGHGTRVAGIDNDQCLGPRIHNPDAIRRGQRDDPATGGFRSCGLPPVVDTDMERAFEQLTPRRVQELMVGDLSADEIEATVHRLNAIKRHIMFLREQGRVITPHRWADAFVDEHANFTNSYFARERMAHAGIVMFGDAAACSARWGTSVMSRKCAQIDVRVCRRSTRPSRPRRGERQRHRGSR